MSTQRTHFSAAGSFLFEARALLCIALAGFVLAGPAAAAESEPKEAKETKYAVDKGISYLPAGDRSASGYAQEMCRLDLYRPEAVQGFPTVVFYHGGGLTGGTRSVPAQLMNRGWAVVGVGYRLHPNVRHPVYIEDAAAALAWTFKNIKSYGGDPDKIFVTAFIESTLAAMKSAGKQPVVPNRKERKP